MDHRGLDLFRGEPTARHVSRGGRPAPATPHRGMPAYESETGALAVMENLLVFPGSATSPPLALPMSYMMVVARTQGNGLTALHDDPDAVWSWRPIIYSLLIDQTQALGSQHELEYRKGLADVQAWKADENDALAAFIIEQLRRLEPRYGPDPLVKRLPKNARKRLYREYAAWQDARDPPDLPYLRANERARAILLEHLSPQQRLDLATGHGFYVRGEMNRLYFVEPGNGFAIVDPVTRETTVSLCLHPEEWMPYDDVALATKLSIDAGRDSEAEMLEAANPRLLRRRYRSTPDDRAARRLEERYRLYP